MCVCVYVCLCACKCTQVRVFVCVIKPELIQLKTSLNLQPGCAAVLRERKKTQISSD